MQLISLASEWWPTLVNKCPQFSKLTKTTLLHKYIYDKIPKLKMWLKKTIHERLNMCVKKRSSKNIRI